MVNGFRINCSPLSLIATGLRSDSRVPVCVLRELLTRCLREKFRCRSIVLRCVQGTAFSGLSILTPKPNTLDISLRRATVDPSCQGMARSTSRENRMLRGQNLNCSASGRAISAEGRIGHFRALVTLCCQPRASHQVCTPPGRAALLQQHRTGVDFGSKQRVWLFAEIPPFVKLRLPVQLIGCEIQIAVRRD